MVTPWQVYDIGDKEFFEEDDSRRPPHFVLPGDVDPDIVENPVQYAARIAQGVKAPIDMQAIEAQGQEIPDDVAQVKAAATPIDATKADAIKKGTLQ
jgi:hypothetical protein